MIVSSASLFSDSSISLANALILEKDFPDLIAAKYEEIVSIDIDPMQSEDYFNDNVSATNPLRDNGITKNDINNVMCTLETFGHSFF